MLNAHLLMLIQNGSNARIFYRFVFLSSRYFIKRIWYSTIEVSWFIHFVICPLKMKLLREYCQIHGFDMQSGIWAWKRTNMTKRQQKSTQSSFWWQSVRMCHKHSWRSMRHSTEDTRKKRNNHTNKWSSEKRDGKKQRNVKYTNIFMIIFPNNNVEKMHIKHETRNNALLCWPIESTTTDNPNYIFKA